PPRAGTGRAARWAPRSRAPGAAPAPALVPGPHRAARVRAARTPAARGALGPCHRASPGAAAAPDPGSGRRPAGAQRRSQALPPGPRVCSEASAPTARHPRVPSALGRRRLVRRLSPHSLGPQRARTPTPTRSAPELLGRARARPRGDAPLSPLPARSRGRTLWPRARALAPPGWRRGGSVAPAAGGVVEA
ncbi:uncharacterized protein LOC115029982, partial [Mus caroli]|uniref:Uncharacterized protein LOC115029982 n=1 Tax=Mus caroli TaxID=10089 RepID=A0A6P7QUG3_MUSCR